MADNVAISAGTGTSIATDDIGGNHYQWMKPAFGADGTATAITDTVGLPTRQTDITASGSITTQNLVPAGTATANSAVLSGDLNGCSVAVVHVTGTYTGALSIQGTVDNAAWVTLSDASRIRNSNSGAFTATIASGTTGLFQFDASGFRQFRVTGLAAMTGTAVVTIRATNGASMVAISSALPAGSAIIGALSANQSTNVAQMNGVTVTMGNGASGTGVQRVTIASDSTGTIAVGSLPASTNTLEVVGDVAEDIPLAANPVRVGVRAHSGVPTAMSASNDAVTPWADLSGAQVVVPQPRQVLITVTPTISAALYAANDVVGAANTITSAALASGRAGQIVGATLIDKGKQNANLQCWIFAVSPTLVNADNGVFDITDANLVTALPVGVIDFAAANYKSASANSVVNGTVNGGAPQLPFVTSGSANLFCAFMTTGTPTYASTSDLVLYVTINQF